MLNSDSDDSEVEAYEIFEYEQPEETSRPAEERLNIDTRMDKLPEAPTDVNDLRPTGMNVTSSNTGPKGVKADFEQAKKNLRTQRMMDKIRMERAMQNKAEGERQIHLNLGNLALDDQKQQKPPPKKKKISDSDSDDDSDDETFQKYRQQRLQQAQMIQNSLPTFGVHARVTLPELKAIIKNTHELCYIVVHLYQNHVEACIRINFAMENLAQQFPHVRFVRIRSTEAIPGYAPVGLPTLMIYRGGDLVTSAVRVTDALPKHFTDLDVAKLLQSKQVLSVPGTFTEHQLNASTEEWLAKDDDSSTPKNHKLRFSQHADALDEDSD